MNIQLSAPQSPANVANGSYLSCKKYSFAFVDAKTRFAARGNRKEELTEDMGGKPSGFKKVVSVVAILVAIGLACIEAKNTQTVISGSIGLDENVALIIGFLFSALGMLCGEMITNVKKDEFTGKRAYTPAFWGAVALTLVYLGGTYFLASGAESAASDDMRQVVHSTTYYVLTIAVLEVLFGALFLKMAIQTLSLMLLSMRMRLCQLRMKTTSRATERYWQKHTYDVAKHNEKHGTAAEPGEETPAIIEARAYYNNGGFTA